MKHRLLVPSAALGAIALARWLRIRRLVRVPPDGAALNHLEKCEWTGFLRGWDQTAPEPTYENESGEQ